MTAPVSVERALRTLVSEGVRQGRLGPGSRLPTERELVERLTAPRSAVRRALAILEREGLLIRHVGRGTFLAESLENGAVHAPADTSPAEIMQVRLLLEPQIAPLAARAATQADLDRIAHDLDRGGTSSDFDSFEQWDASLHRSIARAAHNGLLLTLFDAMNAARELPVWGGLKRRTSTAETRQEYHAEHVAIVEALRERDPDAARSRMHDHLDNVSAHLLGRS